MLGLYSGLPQLSGAQCQPGVSVHTLPVFQLSPAHFSSSFAQRQLQQQARCPQRHVSAATGPAGQAGAPVPVAKNESDSAIKREPVR